MAEPVGLVEVGDESAHEARLAHPGGDVEAKGRKVSLEVLDSRKGRLDCLECFRNRLALVKPNQATHSVEQVKAVC